MGKIQFLQVGIFAFLLTRHHQRPVATRVGACDAVLCLPTGSAADHLHHQCHRVGAHPIAQDHQDAGHGPTDEAATKLLWLALRNITADWSRATREWKSAMNQFAILYAERFKPSAA